MNTSIFLLVTLVVATNGLSINDLPKEIPNGGKLWVVLTAGSNGYYNYRHQADMCHAYQVVHNHGVPDENIITMMYDDIAYSKDNPVKGVIINRPNGTNVYKGVPKDYTGKDVTAENFLNVLLGKQTNGGNGKTIMSGPNDYIFVYFTDHGAKGLLGFPLGVPPLKATDLIQTLKKMHMDKKYKKMTIYVEACESGSMFKGILPPTWNIFATTASNATTSSYACYYSEKFQTYLGDVYSVKWLEDSDREDLRKETLEKQYKIVKKETNTSTVCQFGDMSISHLMVGEFQGDVDIVALEDDPPSDQCGRDAVPSSEVPKVILEKKLAAAQTQEEHDEAQAALQDLMEKRKLLIDTTRRIVHTVTGENGLTSAVFSSNHELTNFGCYNDIVDDFHNKCFNLGCNEFGLRQVNYFANMCEMGYSKVAIQAAIDQVCSEQEPICGII